MIFSILLEFYRSHFWLFAQYFEFMAQFLWELYFQFIPSYALTISLFFIFHHLELFAWFFIYLGDKLQWSFFSILKNFFSFVKKFLASYSALLFLIEASKSAKHFSQFFFHNFRPFHSFPFQFFSHFRLAFIQTMLPLFQANFWNFIIFSFRKIWWFYFIRLEKKVVITCFDFREAILYCRYIYEKENEDMTAFSEEAMQNQILFVFEVSFSYH